MAADPFDDMPIFDDEDDGPVISDATVAATPATDPAQPDLIIPIENLLSASTINFIKAAPDNAMVRGLVLAETGWWLPDDLFNAENKTAKTIFGWIMVQGIHPDRKKEKTLSFVMTHDVRETGTCDFRRTMRINRNFTITLPEIEQIARASNGLQDFYNRITGWFAITAQRASIEGDDDRQALGDLEIDDEDITRTEPMGDWQTSQGHLRDECLQLIYERSRNLYDHITRNA